MSSVGSQDLSKEDGLDNDIYRVSGKLWKILARPVFFWQADDPANCLLQEGFAGILFEGLGL